jgi:membrane fusion protein (multidrug efflux system)
MTDPVPPARARRLSLRGAIVVACAVAAMAGGAIWIAAPKSRASTDDAYLKADSTTVAPKVRGLVTEVLVHDNQVVDVGEPLVRIGAEEFDARVAAAAADLQTAHAAVDAAKAALTSLDAEERLADSNVTAVETAIRSADAQSSRAVADEGRYDRLTSTGAVSRRDAELYKAAAVTAQSELDRSRAALAVSRNQSALTRAKRATLLAGEAQAQAAVARGEAALALAKQDQDHALIRAPIAGVVGDRQARVGDYVQPGSRLLTLVPLHSLYVVANFKETQTGRMTAGARASIEVDALPGVELTGVVDSFAPGSGSEFSLLPFEPGTGNFTKIVQRVPVRIRLDPGQAGTARLRPGLSATVVVQLGEHAGATARADGGDAPG